jgi:hypothetical protein
MNVDLKKFEQTRKTNIATTIWGWLWLGVEELWRAVSGSKKVVTKGSKLQKNQISTQLDKYENNTIERHKYK